MSEPWLNIIGIGEDGVYAATTYEPADGLLPGKYKVAIECYETPPNMEGKQVRVISTRDT